MLISKNILAQTLYWGTLRDNNQLFFYKFKKLPISYITLVKESVMFELKCCNRRVLLFSSSPTLLHNFYIILSIYIEYKIIDIFWFSSFQNNCIDWSNIIGSISSGINAPLLPKIKSKNTFSTTIDKIVTSAKILVFEVYKWLS